MEYTIRFRSLADKLTPKELKLFFSSLINNNKTDFLLTALFNQLLIQSKKNNANTCDQCIATITKIIHNRAPITNSKKHDEPLQKDISIKSLSSATINNIGSYLPFPDLVKMERVNRRFFVSLRIPYPALQSIGFGTIGKKADNMAWMNKYRKKFQNISESPNFQQFKSVKSIVLKCSNLQRMSDEYGLDNVSFNKANDVCFDGKNIKQFNDLFQWNVVNFHKIEQLTLASFTYKGTKNAAELYKKMILCSKYLKSINYRNLTYNVNNVNNVESDKYLECFNEISLRSVLPNLKSFFVYKTDWRIYKNVLNAMCDQIESLHIDDENAFINNLSFKNIREFCMRGSRIQITIAINTLLKTVNNLQKVHLRINGNRNLNGLGKKNYYSALQRILSIPSLEYIGLNMNYKQIMKIKEILESSVMIKRNKLKIFLDVYCGNNNIDQLLLQLATSLNTWILQKRFKILFNFDSVSTMNTETQNKLKQIVDIQEFEHSVHKHKIYRILSIPLTPINQYIDSTWIKSNCLGNMYHNMC